MVATNAFGMGIDKSNVSFVIHYNMPKSIEAYYQEAGRAGRDGAEADCILLFNSGDVQTARFLINNGSDNEEMDAVQREEVRRQDLERLDAMIGYCKTKSCLRGYILDYFGQKHPAMCGNCGSCKGNFQSVDITREAQIILSCVKRVHDALGYNVGANLLGNILRGSRNKRVQELGLDKISTYGLLKDRTRSDIHAMIDHLEAEGYPADGAGASVRVPDPGSGGGSLPGQNGLHVGGADSRNRKRRSRRPQSSPRTTPSCSTR